MKKTGTGILAALFVLTVLSANLFAHCEVPCGIYDDDSRFREIREHATTIEKAMKQIVDLQKGDNPNQLVRWIVAKEAHANDIQHITSQYFMTQRIKPGVSKYAEKLEQLHLILVYAMKCKQTVDLEQVNKLRGAVDAFEKLYTK